MVRNDESVARIKLAGRILTQLRCGGDRPVILSEIAHLRFFAESDEEMESPLDRLAQTVIERESRKMGIPSPWAGRRPASNN